MKILITGMGGSGKTTVIKALSLQSFNAVDLDETDLCYWVNKETGEREEYYPGAGSDWLERHSWRIDIEALRGFLATFADGELLYIGGKIATSQIQNAFSLFDKIFLLSPSNETLSYRQSHRINKENKFAQSEEEQEHILQKRKSFEDACLANGAISLDADKSINDVVSEILNLTSK